MVLSLKGFAAINDEPYCKPHYMKLFHSKGNYAGFTDENARSGSTYTGAAFMGMSQVAYLSGSKSLSGSSSPGEIIFYINLNNYFNACKDLLTIKQSHDQGPAILLSCPALLPLQ